MSAGVHDAEVTWEDMNAESRYGYRYVGCINLRARNQLAPVTPQTTSQLAVSADDDLGVAVTLEGDMYMQTHGALQHVQAPVGLTLEVRGVCLSV
jgi:hypothetical protein